MHAVLDQQVSNRQFSQATIISDIHLGWAPMRNRHHHFIKALPALVDDSELIILNGDIIDLHRGIHREECRESVDELASCVQNWRKENRQVVYVEGNHDPISDTCELEKLTSPELRGQLVPTAWKHEFTGHFGERNLVLHGHRFTEELPRPVSKYHRHHWGKHVLRFDNWLSARYLRWREWYPLSVALIVGFFGAVEDFIENKSFPKLLSRFAPRYDRVIYGHIHSGPGHIRLPKLDLYRSGGWVAPAQRGTVNRVLRYRKGVYERVALENGRWCVGQDNR